MRSSSPTSHVRRESKDLYGSRALLNFAPKSIAATTCAQRTVPSPFSNFSATEREAAFPAARNLQPLVRHDLQLCDEAIWYWRLICEHVDAHLFEVVDLGTMLPL